MGKKSRSRFVSTRSLQNGMKIDQTIKDRTGRTLIAYGTVLDDFMIEALPRLGINGIYVNDGEDEPEETEIPEQTQKLIEKLKVSDRSRVKLTESVKARVVEGVQFLYGNTESTDFENATSSITNELMKAITDNDAIAIDIDMLKVSDEYTFKHSVDVATMAMIIAKQYGLSKKEIYDIGIAGLLHDIGKSKIPNEVLNKPDRLTDEEFHIMKQHSLLGYDILKEKKDLSKPILMGVLQHHEKINGKGYPLGVAEEKINLYAKIISVADIYDALVTERPYKKAFSKRDAVEMIMSMTAELDISIMKSFMDSVILYPVDSIVRLSNGEKAKVVENNANYTMRPKVVGILSGKVYDLANDMNCANIIIL